MAFEIEIFEEYRLSCNFGFRPVIVEECDEIMDENIIGSEDVFSVDEVDFCLVADFFEKYYDPELIFNKNWYDVHDEFYWDLTPNFFTYRVMERICDEILETAELFERIYKNPVPDEIKVLFLVIYKRLFGHEYEVYRDNSPETIRQRLRGIIDYYRRFAGLLRKLMKDNPNMDLISVQGP